MTESRSRVQALLAEFRRRRVFRVAVVYGATAFVILQVAEIVFPSLGLPDWTLTFLVVVTLLGFPLALVLAWAFELTPEGVKRTEPANAGGAVEASRMERRRHWQAGVLAVLGTALLFAGVWFTLDRISSEGDAPSAEGRLALSKFTSAVAVMPFSVRGPADIAYLGEGMVNLLSTKLDGAGELRSVDPRALLRLVEREGIRLGDPDAARDVAERFGADYYVLGDLVEVSGRVQLSGALYDRRLGVTAIGRGAAEGTSGELFDLVDALAAQLLSGVSGGPAARVRRIAAVTTTSLPALKSFLEGESLFRRGQFGAAVDAFRRATVQDSLFALAHYRLSIAAEWNLEEDLAREAAEDAVRHSARLSERDRRLLEVFLSRRRGANDDAELLYRSILGTYPDDMEAWLDLAEILFHANPLRGRSFVDSREALEKVLDFDARHSTSLIHLARVAAYEGHREELDSLATWFIELNPEPARTLEIEALHAFATGDENAIERILARMEGAEDLGVALGVWASAVYSRNMDGGVQLARMLTAPTRSPEARRLGYAWLAHLALARGSWSGARGALEELAELSAGVALEYQALLSLIPFVPVESGELRSLRERLSNLDPTAVERSDNPSVVFSANDRLHTLFRLYLICMIEARLGRAIAAEACAGQFSGIALSPTAGSLAEDLAHSVVSQIRFSQGDDRAALAELEQAKMETWYGQTMASPLYSQVYERFTRAELLYRLGRDDEALSWYANLVEMSPFELPYLAVSHLRRAQIYERRGQLDDARRNYEAFVELWDSADLELEPELTQAKERLRLLR